MIGFLCIVAALLGGAALCVYAADPAYLIREWRKRTKGDL